MFGSALELWHGLNRVMPAAELHVEGEAALPTSIAHSIPSLLPRTLDQSPYRLQSADKQIPTDEGSVHQAIHL